MPRPPRIPFDRPGLDIVERAVERAVERVVERAARPPRAGARGFTLAEMLAVLAMISVLVVTASPVFTRMMRDRRVNRTAMQIADMYRTGRSRAIGRNLPVLVTWDKNAGAQVGGSGLLTMVEPDVLLFANSRSCLGTNFAGGAGVVHTVATIDIGNGAYDAQGTAALDLYDLGVKRVQADVCFSGRGRTYIRYGAAAFNALTDVVRMDVTNAGAGGTGRVRSVFIPPNGVARLGQL